jgi:hypothetical protein
MTRGVSLTGVPSMQAEVWRGQAPSPLPTADEWAVEVSGRAVQARADYANRQLVAEFAGPFDEPPSAVHLRWRYGRGVATAVLLSQYAGPEDVYIVRIDLGATWPLFFGD